MTSRGEASGTGATPSRSSSSRRTVTWRVEEFTPEQFVARDDQVIVFGHERMRTRAGGRVYGTDWVHVFTMRDGKIVGFREYTDTATIVEALRQEGRPSPAFTGM